MNNRIKIIIGLIVVMSLVLFNFCTRSKVKDPNMTGPAGFRIILSGTANPSTLYIPEAKPQVTSLITVTVLYNDGTPVVNGQVIFQTSEYGYFTNMKLTDTRTTDASGVARITYIIPRGTYKTGDSETYIKATLQDDGRVDNNPLSHIMDNIPIRVISYGVKEKFRINGHVWDINGIGIEGVPIAISDVGIIITGPLGGYSAYAPWHWTGTVKAGPLTGYGFSPAQYSYTNPVTTDLDDVDFIASVTANPTLAAAPTTLNFSEDGSETLQISVYNSTTTDAIPFIISISSTDFSTSVMSGSTPLTIDVDADTDNTGLPQKTATITITSTMTGIAPVVITVHQEGT